SMRVWFETDKLTGLSLTPSDIIDAISKQNRVAPVGRIGAQPIGDASFQLNIQTQGRLVDTEEFGNIIVRANPDGSVLRVRDVARLELGAAIRDVETRTNGKPSILIATYLAPGANAVGTGGEIKRTMDQLRQNFPEGLQDQIVYDTTVFVQLTIHEVIKTLEEAFVLVVIVVLMF